MPLLVAAATDQTGRTITLLSAGLVAVALGLTALTIWYWRFTSPRRRAAAVDAGAAESEPVAAAEGPGEIAADPVPVAEPAPEAPRQEDEPPIGLDGEQWDVLTKAVMDEYLDS